VTTSGSSRQGLPHQIHFLTSFLSAQQSGVESQSPTGVRSRVLDKSARVQTRTWEAVLQWQ